MNLQVDISASPYDDHYDMALVYCFDKSQNYCFSLSRAPDSSEIEIMVCDQINCKVNDLDLILYRNFLKVNLSAVVAAKLDGHQMYKVEFELDDQEYDLIHQSLDKIFEGKKGFIVNAF